MLTCAWGVHVDGINVTYVVVSAALAERGTQRLLTDGVLPQREMGRTRRGSTYERALTEDAALNADESVFSRLVLSPTLAGSPPDPLNEEPVGWATETLGWDQRPILVLIAESLIRDSNSTNSTNGAAHAASFLTKISSVSKALRHLAISPDVWRPLLSLTFGPDYYVQTDARLPPRGRQQSISLYAQLRREMSVRPSFFFRSLILRRDGKVRVADAGCVDGPIYRDLTVEERSRVALWAPRFTLIDEAGFDLPVISPRVLADVPKLARKLARQTVGEGAPTPTPKRSRQSFSAPDGDSFCTVAVMLRAIREFDHGVDTAESDPRGVHPMACLADLVPVQHLPGHQPEFVLEWLNDEAARAVEAMEAMEADRGAASREGAGGEVEERDDDDDDDDEREEWGEEDQTASCAACAGKHRAHTCGMAGTRADEDEGGDRRRLRGAEKRGTGT